MKTLISIIILSTLLLSNLCGQKLTFEISKGKKVIGTLEAWKHAEQENHTFALQEQATPYSSQSNSLTANYEDGKLVSAISRSQPLNQEETATRVKWNGATYQILQGNSYTTLDQGPASVSVASLYFYEPIGQKLVFSEQDGQFIPLKQLSLYTYSCQLANGDQYYFSYENGECVGVKWVQSKATITYKLVDSQTFAAF